MSTYEWLLFLHLLAAFLLVAGLVAYSVLVLSSGGEVVARVLGSPALALWNAGGIGTLVFGVWLALDVDGYELWDGWILGALVLWAFGGWAGGEAGKKFQEEPVGGRAAGIRFQSIYSVAILLILILMIWKPGA
jgi:hypothetical protein